MWGVLVCFFEEDYRSQISQVLHRCRYPAGEKNVTSRIERKMNLGSRGLFNFCLILWEIGEFAQVMEKEKLMHEGASVTRLVFQIHSVSVTSDYFSFPGDSLFTHIK